jgi:hypothetical protein
MRRRAAVNNCVDDERRVAVQIVATRQHDSLSAKNNILAIRSRRDKHRIAIDRRGDRRLDSRVLRGHVEDAGVSLIAYKQNSAKEKKR